jgi:hypothetical protein
MAFMNQEKKAIIKAELDKVVPKDWKYSLTVQHHSSITIAIMSAPVDLIGLHAQAEQWKGDRNYIQLNEYYLENQYQGEVLKTLLKIKDALNTGNFDKSDIQTDHFHVGFYAHMHIGKWDKGFVHTNRTPTYDELKARIAQLEKSA